MAFFATSSQLRSVGEPTTCIDIMDSRTREIDHLDLVESVDWIVTGNTSDNYPDIEGRLPPTRVR